MEDYQRCLDNILSYNSTLCNSFDMDYTYKPKYFNSDCCCICHRSCCPNNCAAINYSMTNENYFKNNERLNQLECEKMSLENLNKNLQKQIEMYSKFDNDVMKENETLKGMLNKSVDVFKAVEEKSQLPQNKVFGNLNYYLDKPNEFNHLMNSQSNWIKTNAETPSLSSTLKNDNYSNNPFGVNMNNRNYPFDDNKFYTFHSQPKFNLDKLNNSDYNPLNNQRDWSNNYSPNLNSTSNFGNSQSNPFNDNLNKSNRELQNELEKKSKENEQLKNMLNSSIPLFKAVEQKSLSPNNKFNGKNIDYYLDNPNEFNNLMDSQKDWILKNKNNNNENFPQNNFNSPNNNNNGNFKGQPNLNRQNMNPNHFNNPNYNNDPQFRNNKLNPNKFPNNNQPFDNNQINDPNFKLNVNKRNPNFNYVPLDQNQMNNNNNDPLKNNKNGPFPNNNNLNNVPFNKNVPYNKNFNNNQNPYDNNNIPLKSKNNKNIPFDNQNPDLNNLRGKNPNNNNNNKMNNDRYPNNNNMYPYDDNRNNDDNLNNNSLKKRIPKINYNEPSDNFNGTNPINNNFNEDPRKLNNKNIPNNNNNYKNIPFDNNNPNNFPNNKFSNDNNQPFKKNPLDNNNKNFPNDNNNVPNKLKSKNNPNDNNNDDDNNPKIVPHRKFLKNPNNKEPNNLLVNQNNNFPNDNINDNNKFKKPNQNLPKNYYPDEDRNVQLNNNDDDNKNKLKNKPKIKNPINDNSLLNLAVPLFKAIEIKSGEPQNKFNGTDDLNYYYDKPDEFESLINNQKDWIFNNNFIEDPYYDPNNNPYQIEYDSIFKNNKNKPNINYNLPNENVLKNLLFDSFPLFKSIENKSNLPQNKVYDDDNIDNVIDYYKNYPEEFKNLIDNQVDWVLKTNQIPLNSDPNFSTGEFNSKGFKPYDSIPMKNSKNPNENPNNNNNLPFDNKNAPFNKNKNPNKQNPNDFNPDNNDPNLRIIPHKLPRYGVPDEDDSNSKKPKLNNDSQQPLYYQNITLPNDDELGNLKSLHKNPKKNLRAKSAKPGKKNVFKNKRLKRHLFGRIDLSRSGYLSFNEFERGFKDYFDPKVYKEVVRLTFQQAKNLSSRDPEIQDNIKKSLNSKRKTLKGGLGQRIRIRDIDNEKIEFFEFEKALATFKENCIYFHMFKKICKVDENDVNFINKRKFNKEDFYNAKKKLIRWGLDKSELENDDAFDECNIYGGEYVFFPEWANYARNKKLCLTDKELEKLDFSKLDKVYERF